MAVSALAVRASDQLTAALATDGMTFEVIQTSTVKARSDGPLVPIPDPADRSKELGEAAAYAVGTLVQRGVVTPDGYWLELIHGPLPGAESDFDLAKATPSRQGLVRDGVQYRNDGAGWHQTNNVPGIGLDPSTIAKLPELLAGAATAKEVPISEPAPTASPALDARFGQMSVELDAEQVAAAMAGLVGPEKLPIRALAAETSAALLPGIIATDLAEDTDLVDAVELRFDDEGRLAALSATARNLRMADYDLVVDTLILLRYPTGPPTLPQPEPRYAEPSVGEEGER